MLNKKLAILLSAIYLLSALNQIDLRPIEKEDTEASKKTNKHEYYMDIAIEEGKRNSYAPFGALMVEESTGEIVSTGYNPGTASSKNYLNHGEIVTILNFVNSPFSKTKSYSNLTLYTTAEPCPMCMGAIAWSGIPRVVWGTSITDLMKFGIGQINISAVDVAAAATSFYKPIELVGGIRKNETDYLFENRKHRKV